MYISLNCALSHVIVITLGWDACAVVKADCLESWRSRVRTPLCYSSFKLFLPRSLVKMKYCWSLLDPEVVCSASYRQDTNFESCVRRAVSSHHTREVVLSRFCLDVHIGDLKSHSFIHSFIHSFMCD